MVELHNVSGFSSVARESFKETLENFLEKEKSGAPGDVGFRREQIRSYAIRFAFDALVVAHDDVAATEYFKLASEYALKSLLTAKGSPLLQSADIEAGVDPETLDVRVNSLTPREGGYGSARMSVRDYGNGLFTLWAFGGMEDLRKAAKIPEADYRSPGIIAPDWAWRSMDADKALALGADAEALNLLRGVSDQLNDNVKGKLIALEALLAGDDAAFRSRLIEMLKTHKRLMAKSPGDLAGLICFPATMLCRVAFQRGILIEDQNYLPLRFMPGHPSNTGGRAAMGI